MKMHVTLTTIENIINNKLIDNSKIIYRTYDYEDNILTCDITAHWIYEEQKVANLNIFSKLILENEKKYKILKVFSQPDTLIRFIQNPPYQEALKISESSEFVVDRGAAYENGLMYENESSFILCEDNKITFLEKKNADQPFKNLPHRIDGPAIVYENICDHDRDAYFLNGELFSEEKWKQNEKVMTHFNKINLKEKIYKL